MAKTKDQKKVEVTNLTKKFKEAKGVVFVDYKGLTVKEVEELRKELRANEVDHYVAKKTLANIALKEAGNKDVDTRSMEGQLAIGFGKEDEIMPARLLHKFAKTHKSLKLLGGIVENEYLGDKEIISLALMPSKQELLAKVVGSIGAPLAGFVRVLKGNLNSLVYALKAIADKKAN